MAEKQRVIRGGGAAVLLLSAALLPGCGAARANRVTPRGEPAAAMSAAALSAFDLVNAQRVANGLASLNVSSRCVAAAQSHAEKQAARKTLSHGSLTESFEARMKSWGLLEWAVGENVGRGATAAAVVEAWLKSPHHRAITLSPAYASAGAGVAGDTYTLCLSGGPGD